MQFDFKAIFELIEDRLGTRIGRPVGTALLLLVVLGLMAAAVLFILAHSWEASYATG